MLTYFADSNCPAPCHHVASSSTEALDSRGTASAVFPDPMAASAHSSDLTARSPLRAAGPSSSAWRAGMVADANARALAASASGMVHSTGIENVAAADTAARHAAVSPAETPAASSHTGRRPRASVEDWGGGLGEVLARAPRADRRAAPGACVAVVPARPQPSPDLSAWGGSGLGEVLARCPQQRCARERTHSSPAVADRPRQTAHSTGGAVRPRATNMDWGGGLADVLGRAPTPRRTAAAPTVPAPPAPAAEDLRPSRPPTPAASGWGGSLGDVLPPREAAAAVSVGQGVAVGQRSRRRARSVVVRRGDKMDDCCPICLDDFEVRQKLSELPCRHRFHTGCLRRYFETAARLQCPNCRRDCSDILV